MTKDNIRLAHKTARDYWNSIQDVLRSTASETCWTSPKLQTMYTKKHSEIWASNTQVVYIHEYVEVYKRKEFGLDEDQKREFYLKSQSKTLPCRLWTPFNYYGQYITSRLSLQLIWRCDIIASIVQCFRKYMRAGQNLCKRVQCLHQKHFT